MRVVDEVSKLQFNFDPQGIISAVNTHKVVSEGVRERVDNLTGVNIDGFDNVKTVLETIQSRMESMNIYGAAPLRTVDIVASVDLLNQRVLARAIAQEVPGISESDFDIRGRGTFGEMTDGTGFMDRLNAFADTGNPMQGAADDIHDTIRGLDDDLGVLNNWIRLINAAGIPGNFQIDPFDLFQATGGPVYASGGASIFKPRGTDTVPAMLTPGEFVIR